MLRIKNLKKYFGGVKAVDDCSFNLDKNSIVALIGPNGSGKTTLLNLISGIVKKNSGEIYFDNEKILSSSVFKVSNLGISRLFQHSRLFSNLSVRENLELGLRQDNTNFIKSVFGKKNFDNQEKQIKKISKLIGIESLMNRKAKDLSYGQKRLVEIARAILKPHKVLLLDEPVAGVNPKLRREITSIIFNLKKSGETILFIEHDFDFVSSVADKVIVMDEGKIIMQGHPREIKNNKKVLEAYFGE